MLPRNFPERKRQRHIAAANGDGMTAAAKFTPWRVVKNDGSYIRFPEHAVLRIEQTDDMRLVVALVVSDVADLDHEANANLIAASPEMLAALRGAEVALDLLPYPDGLGAEVVSEIDKRRAAIRAAIAKAEGRS